MIDPDDTVVVMINCNTEFFRHTFSKMEFLMGMDYMNSFISSYNVPIIFTRRELSYDIRNPDLKKIKDFKEKNRKKNMPTESDYDENFIKEFNRKIIIKDEIKVQKEDIFYHSNIESILERDMIGLDAATGAGFTAIKMAQKISEVYALDMVDRMLDKI